MSDANCAPGARAGAGCRRPDPRGRRERLRQDQPSVLQPSSISFRRFNERGIRCASRPESTARETAGSQGTATTLCPRGSPSSRFVSRTRPSAPVVAKQFRPRYSYAA